MAEKEFKPGLVDYDTDIAANYPAARAFSDETAATWIAIIEPFLACSHSPTVLDLGCGTGRFSALFAERFAVRTIGLDPALAMLRAATQSGTRDNLFYAAARSEQLPLADSSCNLAWLSQMIHHVADRDACARELRRVLQPDGHVMIRGTFGDWLDGCPDFFRFFPGARALAARFPRVDQVITSFRFAGFVVERRDRVKQKICASLAELAQRTRLRADSTLRLLPDAEFERCQAALENAAASEKATPVIETLDLLILSIPRSSEVERVSKIASAGGQAPDPWPMLSEAPRECLSYLAL